MGSYIGSCACEHNSPDLVTRTSLVQQVGLVLVAATARKAMRRPWTLTMRSWALRRQRPLLPLETLQVQPASHPHHLAFTDITHCIHCVRCQGIRASLMVKRTTSSCTTLHAEQGGTWNGSMHHALTFRRRLAPSSQRLGKTCC